MKNEKKKQELKTEMRELGEVIAVWADGNSCRGLVLAMVDTSTDNKIVCVTQAGNTRRALYAVQELLRSDAIQRMLAKEAIFGEV